MTSDDKALLTMDVSPRRALAPHTATTPSIGHAGVDGDCSSKLGTRALDEAIAQIPLAYVLDSGSQLLHLLCNAVPF
ncbi:hypothetical protein EJB05_01412 [Eragrostis curvula]|uniref:Uncharacterized protein n=1 Tax=Eragrostis curvula TaxID=38414 RepID=A0A5J9WQ61_9POAL|nr:hypothetical protein EJB05_01412 [Eragrostis curvula]